MKLIDGTKIRTHQIIPENITELKALCLILSENPGKVADPKESSERLLRISRTENITKDFLYDMLDHSCFGEAQGIECLFMFIDMYL